MDTVSNEIALSYHREQAFDTAAEYDSKKGAVCRLVKQELRVKGWSPTLEQQAYDVYDASLQLALDGESTHSHSLYQLVVQHTTLCRDRPPHPVRLANAADFEDIPDEKS